MKPKLSGLLIVALIIAIPASSQAVTKCKVKVDRKTGVIKVDARDVVGSMRWGGAAGEETSAFFNESACVVGTKARRCTLAADGTVEAITPPSTCFIYLADDGAESCSAFISGCTPGLRSGTDVSDGIHCWDLDENDQCDLVTEDINTDGGCDVFDCEGPEGPTGPQGPAGTPGQNGAGYSLANCGDGVTDTLAGEQCDDGNRQTGDGCNAFCQENVCGDAVVSAPGEQCDEGAGNNDSLADACRLDCSLPGCGDGVADTGESCDDGGESAACNSDCTGAECGDGKLNTSAGEQCDDSGESAACDSDCTAVACGDGTVNGTAGEACDDGGANSDTTPDACRTDCSLPSCGDGVVDSSEGCDDGPGNSDIAPDACRTDCSLSSCGDGIIDTGEQCDDNGESATCDSNCTPAGCGDGTLNGSAGEQCDDGGTVDGDGCSATCLIEGSGNATYTSIELLPLADSDIDSGTTGSGHNATIATGSALTFNIAKECVGGASAGSTCSLDADCGVGICDPTCNVASECPITGPALQGRCLVSLSLCDTDADCSLADGSLCLRFFGPPQPTSGGGVPTCVTQYFQQDISGTIDPGSGHSELNIKLRSRVHLGLQSDQPCPRCGSPAQNPSVGDAFNCEGGPHDGASCTVGGFSPQFGGVSFDCPPDSTTNVSGQGLAIIFPKVTTRTDSQTASLLCAPPFNLSGVCTHNLGMACSQDSECQAIHPKSTCGFFCHCGFCATAAAPQGDPDQPCFNDGQCAEVGSTCIQGTGSVPANAAQAKPNGCTVGFCGKDEDERCHDITRLACSGNHTPCASAGLACIGPASGTCLVEQTPCFEGTITRSGAASPLGSYCVGGDVSNDAPCTSDADCAGAATCRADTSKPTFAALTCTPATASGSINNVTGVTGPSALTMHAELRLCSCGDTVPECAEQCDDGGTCLGGSADGGACSTTTGCPGGTCRPQGGDGCDENCQTE